MRGCGVRVSKGEREGMVGMGGGVRVSEAVRVCAGGVMSEGETGNLPCSNCNGE